MRGIFDRVTTPKPMIMMTVSTQSPISNSATSAPAIEPTTTTTTTTVAPPPSSTTTKPSSATSMPSNQPNTPWLWSGYFGGNPMNVTAVDITALPYPSTSYGYPHGIDHSYGPPTEIQHSYGPPSAGIPHSYSPPAVIQHSYGPPTTVTQHSYDSHHHPHDDNQGIYGPPVYEPGQFHQEFYQQQPHADFPADGSIGNSYSAAITQWPIYPPYSRSQKVAPGSNRDSKTWSSENKFIPVVRRQK